VVRALVVYESMYGNTHLVADAVGRGLAGGAGAGGEIDVSVVPVGEATPDRVAVADLLVVGGPTHAHGMSRESTREAAVADAGKPDSGLHLDPDAEGEGLRDWFDQLPRMNVAAAAFDTRFDMAAVITGRASRGISKRLRRHGLREVVDPESFIVERGNTLGAGEEERAVGWGRTLRDAVRSSGGSGSSESAQQP
jgi:hypothetical protein